MFAIGVRYLCGWAMASDPSDYDAPEWPPHPDRLFMALAAAHFESGGTAEERRALEWLESQGPPSLSVSDAAWRTPVTTYVPVNDVELPRWRGRGEPSAAVAKSAVELLPDSRPRQARSFPIAVPECDVVHFIWPDAGPPGPVEIALTTLCRNTTRVGHSASLVTAWLEPEPPEPTLVPGALAGVALRVPGAGRLAALEARFQAGLRPAAALSVRYGAPLRSQAASVRPHTVFENDLLVLRRVEGRGAGLESTLRLTQALRAFVMKHGPQPPLWLVTGHDDDGRPIGRPHFAFLALPHVGREHADGHLLGLAVAIPRGVSPEMVAAALESIVAVDEFGRAPGIRLYDGQEFEWTLELETCGQRPSALLSRTWTRASRRWATVTPIVLDRHPKGPHAWRQEEAILAESCERVGLPRPVEVIPSSVSMFQGAGHCRNVPPLTRKSGGGTSRHTHAVICFAEEVEGPVLLGAGRYRGYGLCRPLDGPDDGES